MIDCRTNRPGLTLLELLLVVFILSMVAFSAVSMTNMLDEQSRFEDTRTRLENIRRAVIGDSSQNVNGQPVISGYASDVGALPAQLQDLLVRPAHVAPWDYDETTGLWGGWRASYLSPAPMSGTYRDGWGNAALPTNHGWKQFDSSGGRLIVQSFGADGIVDPVPPPVGHGYALDYPSPPDAPALVEGADYLVNLRGWRVTVQLQGTAADQEVRLRVMYPQPGNLALPETLDNAFAWTREPSLWPNSQSARDAAVYLSEKKTLASSDTTVTFDFKTNDSSGPVAKLIPGGVRSLAIVNEADGTPLVTQPYYRVVLRPRTTLIDINDMKWKVE